MKNLTDSHADSLDSKIAKGCLLACLFTFVITTLFFSTITAYVNHKQVKNFEQLLKTLAVHIATATNEEYDELTQELRHSLAFIRYDQDTQTLLSYLPNTSDQCPTCQASPSPGPYLLALNTGELYPLIMDTPQPEGTFSHWGGVDELSQSTLWIISDAYLPYNTAHLRQKYTTLSLHRLKNTYCDSCIDKILTAVADIDGDNLAAFLLFTADDTAFYPISPAVDQPLPGIEVLNDTATGELKLNYYR